MCTCMLIKNTHSYFGRNMDLNFSLNEKIIVIPRNYSINFKLYPSIMTHYAFFGFGCVVDNYPLLADGCNEHGLCIAVLNFPENAHYNKPLKNKNNITPFELPLLLLSKCKTIDDVETTLKNINIVDISFSDSISLTDVHFMVSDTEKSIVIESTKQGLNVCQNPFNILTNNPPFLGASVLFLSFHL